MADAKKLALAAIHDSENVGWQNAAVEISKAYLALYADYERDMLQVIGERDKAQETITDCAALFGEQYEWVARIPAEYPPDSGDLHLDLPCLIKDMLAEVEQLQSKYEQCKQQAEIWAQEARAQKATVHEIYQFITGATGEPGDWNGAKPVVEYVEQLREALASIMSYPGIREYIGSILADKADEALTPKQEGE